MTALGKSQKPSGGNVEIRTHPAPICVACGSSGGLAYTDLEDRLFNTPGRWNIRRCTDQTCGMLWLDPMPIDSDLPRLYNDYYTHPRTAAISLASLRQFYGRIVNGYAEWRYGCNRGKIGTIWRLLGMSLYLHGGHRAEADASAMFLPVSGNGRLLEVGFGSGESLIRFRDLGWQVTGIDADPVVVESMAKLGLDVRCGSLADQNFAAGSFDAVVMSHVLEHLSDPKCMLRQVWLVLKSGGTFVGCMPNVKALGHQIFGKHWCGLDPPRHLYTYSPNALARIVREAGFRVDRCGSTGRGAGLLMTSLMIRLHGGIRSWNVAVKVIVLEFGRLLEWSICRMSPSKGEELVVIARKEI